MGGMGLVMDVGDTVKDRGGSRYDCILVASLDMVKAVWVVGQLWGERFLLVMLECGGAGGTFGVGMLTRC